MTYHTFEREVVKLITTKLPSGHNAIVKSIGKNNGVMLHGLIINNGHSNISPTIYLDYYYDKLDEGSSIEELANQIVSQYNKYALEDDFDITIFTDYEKCKSHISYKLINYEQNKSLLKDIPHIVYLDLAIVFYCLLDSDLSQSSSILIRNAHLNMWGVSVDDLYAVASVNTPKLLTIETKKLVDIINELVSESNVIYDSDSHGNVSNTLDDKNPPIYVMTNNIKLYGACCILYENALRDWAKKLKANLYIIPSSIHEVLLIPDNGNFDEQYLTELVRDVNSSQLSLEDVLSDHVYYYSSKEDAITYHL